MTKIKIPLFSLYLVWAQVRRGIFFIFELRITNYELRTSNLVSRISYIVYLISYIELRPNPL